jgi:CubicO group peptidase (beta-lactamase class C family)
MYLRHLAFVGALGFVASACSSSDTSPASGATGVNPSGLDFSKYDAAVSAFLTEHQLAGASGVVVHKDLGIVHVKGYGEYAADRLYLVASSSKMVSVGILMTLVDQGKLDVDAPIGNYLAAWQPNGKPELKVAQLVSNSSGLVGLIDNPAYLPYLCQYGDAGTLGECAKTIYTADDAADRKPPDTEFHYGGGQWQLAGGIAEVASGKKWADLVKETYLDKCDTPTIGYTNQFQKTITTDGVAAALSYPSFFVGDKSTLPVTDNPSIEGGLYTTAEDYGKILLMHLRGGECDGTRVLSEASVARMQEDRILKAYNGSTTGTAGAAIGDAGAQAGALAGYGMGWWIDRVNQGVFADPGAYGAFPWLDEPRNYAAFLVLQSNAGVGAQLWVAVKPALDEVFDSAKL